MMINEKSVQALITTVGHEYTCRSATLKNTSKREEEKSPSSNYSGSKAVQAQSSRDATFQDLKEQKRMYSQHTCFDSYWQVSLCL